jgi:hypothetical protein
MKLIAILVALAASAGPLLAQEMKPVPKDSVRLSIPGCTKGYVFTAGPRTADQPGTANVPEGTHLRMNGPKKLMAEVKAHEGSMIEITGLVKKSDMVADGVVIGGVRIRPGRGTGNDSLSGSVVGSQISIDVEGWRPAEGGCRVR